MNLSDNVNLGIVDRWKPADGTTIAYYKFILDYLDTQAGICEVETTIFFTSVDWADIAAAVQWQFPDVDINPQNFNQLKILKATFVNSRSEDQGAVDFANAAMARATNFQEIRARKRTG